MQMHPGAKLVGVDASAPRLFSPCRDVRGNPKARERAYLQWWAGNSKKAYRSGCANVARGLDNWSRSKASAKARES